MTSTGHGRVPATFQVPSTWTVQGATGKVEGGQPSRLQWLKACHSNNFVIVIHLLVIIIINVAVILIRVLILLTQFHLLIVTCMA